MIGILLASWLGFVSQPAPGPAGLVIATKRGETVIPIRLERGHPSVPAPFLSRVLPLTTEIQGEWAQVSFAGG